MNKKELIVSAIEKMDISMLEVLLDDTTTYQHATKEIFLTRLAAIFKSFQNTGDTLLKAYPGICCSEDCPNKNTGGYTFIGNNTNSYTSFIFEEAENEIRDIRSCSNLVTQHNGIELKNHFYLEIYKDEEADFNPSPDLAISLQKFKNAYDEIIKPGEVFLTKEEYTHWLQKHKDLFGRFQLPPMSYKIAVNFYELYSYLKSFLKYTVFEQESLKASEHYFNINTENENELLAWLVKYETLGDNLTLLLVDYFDETCQALRSFKFESEGCNLNVDINDIKSTFFFKLKFDEYYWSMLEKYKAISEEEESELKEGTEESANRTSLTYHLRKRGLLPTILQEEFAPAAQDL
jgi:hypothetical protein